MNSRSFAPVALAVLLVSTSAWACTGIQLQATDGSVVAARTLEFAVDLKSNIVVIPRNHACTGTGPNNQPGMKWTTKYGMVGANAFDLPLVLDGINEKGLRFAIFYFPGYAKYQDVPTNDEPRVLAPWELGLYLLGTCATVDEAKQAVTDVLVGSVVQPNMGMVPPCHYILTDAGGASVVIEYVDGKRILHNNPLGVVTNSPTFDWHVLNLNNYINLSVNDVASKDMHGITLRSFGQGSGSLGLPGDFTPPSRFVRAALFSKAALPVETGKDAVLQAFHLLNQFDIPKGATRSVENGQPVADYTLWTSAADLKNLRYYFHTYDNRSIRMVDLRQLDLDAAGVKTISMSGDESIEDLTKSAK